MRPFTTDDIFRHRDIASVTGASSHDTGVFTVTRANRRSDDYTARLWALRGSDDTPVALSNPSFDVDSPVLDEAGIRVAFLSARDGGERRAQILSLAGGEAVPLPPTKGKLKSLLQWSGDRLLALESRDWTEDGQNPDFRGKAAPHVVNFLPWKSDGGGAVVGTRTRALALPVDGGEATTLVCGDFDVTGAAWSPDGGRLAWLHKGSGSQRHRSELWLGDADGGSGRRIESGLAHLAGPTWSPDGRHVAFAGTRCEGDSLRRLWLLDVEDRTWTCPQPDLELEGTAFAWDRTGGRLATVASRRGLFQVVVIDVPTGAATPLPLGLSHVTDLAAYGDRLLAAATSFRRGTRVVSMGWDGSAKRRHGDFNRWYRRRARPLVEKRRFTVPDGAGGTEPIEAWVLRQPGHDDRATPLLVDMHGGPESVALLDYPAHVYWFLLIEAGWTIVMPNAVGSGGYGADFARRLLGHWGELDLPQHEAIVTALQAEALADDRVACTGKSYGGYLSAWAVGNSTRFRTAVVSAPVANIESHAGTSDTGYYVSPYAMQGEIPSRRTHCDRLSPVMYCHQATAPTLLLQGEDDHRCPLGQSEELLMNLVRCATAPVRMVVYPGEGHALSSTGKPHNRVDYHDRLARWVREHVEG